jgi:hypothetical protein
MLGTSAATKTRRGMRMSGMTPRLSKRHAPMQAAFGRGVD